MTKYILLSHKLGQDTPSYGNRDRVIIRTNSSIKSGETANSSCWILTNNHIGTHIDVPKHFSEKGKSTFDYPIEYFVFNKVAIIDLQLNAGHLIAGNDIDEFKIPEDVELLLLRTGYEEWRHEDIYWNANPGLDPLFADYIRSRFPKLRCLGFDFISITSWLHRKEGSLAHKAFLCPENDKREILVIEDMSLNRLGTVLKKVVVAPFFGEDGNGGAVSVIGESE